MGVKSSQVKIRGDTICIVSVEFGVFWDGMACMIYMGERFVLYDGLDVDWLPGINVAG